jgi:hypothetical protein
VRIDSQTNLVCVEIKRRIKVFQECVTHYINVLVLATEFALAQDEEALSTTFRLEEILYRLQLKQGA